MSRLALTLGLLVTVASSAQAGGYGGRFQSYSYQQKFFVPAQQFFYFVGAPVRIEALVEAEKRRDPDYQVFLQFKQFRREFEAFQRHHAADPSPMSATPRPDGSPVAGAVVRRCAACHSGTAPQGGVFLDGQHRLTAAQITAAQRLVLRGEMPPAERLSPEESGRVLQDLLALEGVEP